ncbi:MAG TPA: hypothetical protein VMK12_04745, partial [Anaeromyxobacteraceae bacterium]|nr:hypothetical protein [Anaeromyxobacteraceae bacterium]
RAAPVMGADGPRTKRAGDPVELGGDSRVDCRSLFSRRPGGSMARSKSKHNRLISKRRQRWKRRLKTKKAARKATAKK